MMAKTNSNISTTSNSNIGLNMIITTSEKNPNNSNNEDVGEEFFLNTTTVMTDVGCFKETKSDVDKCVVLFRSLKFLFNIIFY